MKKKIFLFRLMTITVIALSVLLLASMVQGTTSDYSFGPSEGDGQQYTVVLNDINDVDGEVGDVITISIHEIEEYDNVMWKVTVYPGSSDDPGTMDLYFFPGNNPTLISFVCPLVVEDYLVAAQLGWQAVYPGTCQADIGAYNWALDTSGTTHYSADMSSNGWQITFDPTTGWATSYKGYKDGTLVTELTAYTPPETPEIPGYELTFLLSVGAVSTLGIIFIMKKRK